MAYLAFLKFCEISLPAGTRLDGMNPDAANSWRAAIDRFPGDGCDGEVLPVALSRKCQPDSLSDEK